VVENLQCQKVHMIHLRISLRRGSGGAISQRILVRLAHRITGSHASWRYQQRDDVPNIMHCAALVRCRIV
jgi:hypothetical protein